MTDAEYIRNEQFKLDKKLLRQLKKIQKTGEIGFKVGEVLTINDLIYWGSPIKGVCRYNCYHLTYNGECTLKDLNKKVYNIGAYTEIHFSHEKHRFIYASEDGRYAIWRLHKTEKGRGTVVDQGNLKRKAHRTRIHAFLGGLANDD